MPAYNTAAPFFLSSGIKSTVWNAEVVAAAGKSQQLCLLRNDLPRAMAVEIKFSADPGSFQVDLQTADTDSDAYYVTKESVSFTNAAWVCRIEVGTVVAKFVRLFMPELANVVSVTATIS